MGTALAAALLLQLAQGDQWRTAQDLVVSRPGTFAVPLPIDTLDAARRSVVVMLTLLLAWLTKIAVEDPARRARRLVNRRATRTFALAAAGMAAVLALTATGSAQLQSELRSEITKSVGRINVLNDQVETVKDVESNLHQAKDLDVGLKNPKVP